ncbi:MAG: 3-isopropylmalate dehydratase large subunit [Bacteroidetes bacterium]|nr:3-isopropylmalate dehydratase large subunit [Bacteroidota bacterium]
MSADTLFDKIWNRHVVTHLENGFDLLFIDRHFIHEVTSPQAFHNLEARGLPILFPERITATADHNVPTQNRHLPVKDPQSAEQLALLEKNCAAHGIPCFNLAHPHQGIVHVIGPELGITRPGMTIVCGDSHTSTHGAFGAVAFGIGTSQVEQVMLSQCLLMRKPKRMRIEVNGVLQPGVSAKDVILYIIAQLGANGGKEHFVEYTGDVFTKMNMEERMTVCNMSIEMGARGGMMAPDETTFAYMKNRLYSLKDEALEKAAAYWETLYTDEQAVFDTTYYFQAELIQPMVTYGTSPAQATGIHEQIPAGSDIEQALSYMQFRAGEKLDGKKIDYVFIGSCTNGRISDLREAARIVRGRKIAPGVTAWVVPGSKLVEQQAVEEGLAEIFRQAGFEFREPGCSACLGMNEDKIPAGSYCVSTGNRNFEGRQGPGARTILASPAMAAAAAIHGCITDVRKMPAHV